MLMHYTSDGFYVSAMPNEVSTCIAFGLRRQKNGFYRTDNWSIASRFAYSADKHCKAVLAGWKPRSNKVKPVAVSPAPTGLSYLSHQEDGIRFALSRERTLLADQQGLGKSVMACAYMRSLAENANYKRFLVVCPAAMRVTWQREITRWCESFAPIINRKVGKVKVGVDQGTDGIMIINYDILKRYTPELLQWLSAADSAIVIDEAHFAKNPEAQRSEAIKRINKVANRSLLLTGTPFPNSHKESFNLFNQISEEHFDSWLYHEDNLKRHSPDFMIRRTRAEVFPDMPPKIRQFVLLASDGMQKQVAAEISAYRRESGREMLEFKDFSRARRELAIKKLPLLMDIAERRYNAVKKDGEKLVVFAYHRDMVEALTAHLMARGANAVSYYGDMTAKEKEDAFQAFQFGDADVMVASIRSAGVGLTLTAASHILFAEIDFVPAMLEQAEDRCMRFGQDKTVLVTYVLVENSFDEFVLSKLLTKQNETNTIIRQTTL